MAARVWIAVALAACHVSEPASPSQTPAGPRACAKAADHLVELMGSRDADPDTVGGIRRAIGDRCANDRWTIDAQQCFGEAKVIAETDRCASLLTVDQREAFDKSLGDALTR